MADIDLTTLDAVRLVLQKKPGEIAQDDVLQAFITRASGLIMRETEREFRPLTDAEGRVFSYRGGRMIDLAPYDLRAATSVVMRLNGTDQTLSADDDYDLRPLPAADGVYRWIQLRRSRIFDRMAERREGTVTVTGDWGFPAVPPEVEHFCVMTVVIWARRDVQAFSATYNLDEGRLERPEALPAAVRAGLRRWRRAVMA